MRVFSLVNFCFMGSAFSHHECISHITRACFENHNAWCNGITLSSWMDYLIFNLNAATRERIIICELQNQFALGARSLCCCWLMPARAFLKEKNSCAFGLLKGLDKGKMKSGAHSEKHNARRLVAEAIFCLWCRRIYYMRALVVKRADVTHKKCPSMSTSFISLCIHKIMHGAASWQLRNFNGRRVKMTSGSFLIFSYINISLSRSFKNLLPKIFKKKSETFLVRKKGS